MEPSIYTLTIHLNLEMARLTSYNVVLYYHYPRHYVMLDVSLTKNAPSIY